MMYPILVKLLNSAEIIKILLFNLSFSNQSSPNYHRKQSCSPSIHPLLLLFL